MTDTASHDPTRPALIAEPEAYELLFSYASARRAIVETQSLRPNGHEEIKVYDMALGQLKICTLAQVLGHLEAERRAVESRIKDPRQAYWKVRWSARLTGITNTIAILRDLPKYLKSS